jgi:hypothetical protein
MDRKEVRDVGCCILNNLHSCGVANANVRALDLCFRVDRWWVELADDREYEVKY